MVRSKPKKQKGDDAFKKRVQKVGRKKLAPVTATRAEIHARTLRISTSAAIGRANPSIDGGDPPSQVQLDQGGHTKGKEGALPKSSFVELLANTNHYKAANRASAFAAMSRLLALQEVEDIQERARVDPFAGFISIRDDIDRYDNSNTNHNTKTTNNMKINSPRDKDPLRLREVTPVQKLKVFMSALDALTDTEGDVRRAALGCLDVLLRGDWVSSRLSGAAAVEHLQVVLHTVHVALTHALGAVRLSGVGLLALALAHGEPAALRQAAREVSRAQPLTHPRGGASQAPTRGRPTALAGAQDSLQEETWMLGLVRRVSALVLRTPHLHVLAALLSVFLMSPAEAGLSLEPAPNEEGDGAPDWAPIAPSTSGVLCAAPDWRHPELVLDLFKELLPQWSNVWKELMELQLALFRHEEKLSAAVALGSSFAVVLTFLKQKEVARRDGVGGGAQGGVSGDLGKIFLSKPELQTMKKLFFHKVPVTTAEILRKEKGDHGSVQSPSLLSDSSSRSAGGLTTQAKYNRVDFALVLAQISAPLATLEEGWNSLYQYFHTAFSKVSRSSSPLRPEVKLSSRHLLGSLEVYLLTLCLFPNLIQMPAASFTTTQTFDANAIEVPDEDGGHGNNAHSMTTASLSPQVGEHEGRPRKPSDTISQRLLPFAPLLLRAVIQHIQEHLQGGIQRHKGPRVKRAPSDDRRDAFLMRILGCATAIVVRLAQFPLTRSDLVASADAAPNRRAGKTGRCEIPHGSRSGQGNLAASQALHDTFLLVPRLLFALRLHTPVKEADAGNGQSLDEESGRDSANEKQSRGDAASSTRGVLVNHPAVVDNVVYKLLRVLWFMVSSGHLLFSADECGADALSKFVPTMRVGLQALFAVPDSSLGSTVHKGVLSRCTERTVELAQHILFYLNVRDAGRMQLLTMREPCSGGEGSDINEKEAHFREETAGCGTMSTTAGMADILLMLPPLLSKVS